MPLRPQHEQTACRQHGLPLDRAYEHCAAVMTENLLAEDAIEGIGAFLAKRPPVWRDR